MTTQRLTIRNGLILTMEPANPVLRGDIQVAGGHIAAIGEQLAEEGPVLDARHLVLVPGFIQTHVHLCQTLFRGLAHDVPLLDWLGKVIKPFEAAHDETSTYLSALVGIAELLLSGTTTVSDFGSVHHQVSILKAIVESGIRAQTGKTLMDNAGHDASTLYEPTEEALAGSERLIQRWHEAAGGRIRMALIPRGLISTSAPLYQGAVSLAQKYRIPLHTHCAENADEIAFICQRTGHHPVDELAALGVLDVHAQLAHCVHVSDDHIQLLSAKGAHVLHCPGSNLKLASGFAPVPAMLSAGVPLSLGSDGAACNDNLDIFTEMRLAALIHKPQGGATAVSASEVFHMATLGGARALDWEDEIGSLAVGKRADIVLLDLNKPHIWPPLPEVEIPTADDLMARIVYSAKGSDVHTVLVDGQVLVRDGRLLAEDRSLGFRARDALDDLRDRVVGHALALPGKE
jgi:cytosine/adenosine deaminase-related metal-dependent hydrolase